MNRKPHQHAIMIIDRYIRVYLTSNMRSEPRNKIWKELIDESTYSLNLLKREAISEQVEQARPAIVHAVNSAPSAKPDSRGTE